MRMTALAIGVLGGMIGATVIGCAEGGSPGAGDAQADRADADSRDVPADDSVGDRVDREDAAAGDDAAPPVEVCTDARDNDGDTRIDCEDPDCDGVPPCPAIRPDCSTMTEGSITVNVAVLIYNPVIESEGSRKLTEVLGWSDPDELTAALVEDVREASCGYVNYNISQRIEVDGYPLESDGFRYDDATYLACMRDADHSECHMPTEISYADLFAANGIADLINFHLVREVWLWGAPYFGYDEYAMKIALDRPYDNPNCRLAAAYWFYRPKDIPDFGMTIWVMGFSYERQEGEMLESYGHRIEGILSITLADCVWSSTGTDPWSHFTWVDINKPGEAQCGGQHYAPNSTTDYDWGNPRSVPSACDDWYLYPSLAGVYRTIGCDPWGCNGIAFKKWWMGHLPHAAGTTDGKQNNWWKYIADLDRAGWL